MIAVNTVLSLPAEHQKFFSQHTKITLPVDQEHAYFRVVTVDSQSQAHLIRLDCHPLKNPFPVPVLKLISGLEEGILEADKEFKIDGPDIKENLSDKARENVAEKEALIKSLLEDERFLTCPNLRNSTLKRTANKHGINPRTLRRLFYSYLASGQTACGLFPHYHQRGGKGRPQKPGTARRGPKADDSNILTLPDIRVRLENGARLYYLNGKNTLKEAYTKTLKRYFSKKGVITPAADLSRVSIDEIIVSPEQRPSLRQFRYICQELESLEGKRSKAPRRSKKNKSQELPLGKARDNVLGPGHRYEIDATKLQIRIVSRYGRQHTLETPTLYVIIDVWSGAIVGYSLSLHPASWASAAAALHCALTPKGPIFERLGLDYADEEWPCHHAPINLTADRGEMVSNKAGPLTDCGIILEICPSMAPERKGSVEGMIKRIKHDHSFKLPGRYEKIRLRRQDDGHGTAALNLDEMETLIVEFIMRLNQEPVPAHYIPEELVAMGETDVSHLGLFQWGLKHRAGHTRQIPSKQLYTALMRKEEASITSAGLLFKKMTYNSSDLRNSPIALNDRTPTARVSIRWDERFADQIWFHDDALNDWVPAFNTDQEVQRLKQAFFENEALLRDKEKLRVQQKLKSLHQNDEKDPYIKAIGDNALKEAKSARAGLPKTTTKKDMRLNTQAEMARDDLIQGLATVSSLTQGIDSARKKSAQTCDDAIEGRDQYDASVRQKTQEIWKENQ